MCRSDDPIVIIQKEYRKRGMEVPFKIEDDTNKLADIQLDGRIRVLYDFCNFILENGNNFEALLKGLDDASFWVHVMSRSFY